MNLPISKPRADRPDGRLFLTEENLDRGTLTLLAAARRVDLVLRQAAPDADLSQTELSILTEIARNPGLDVSELRRRLGGTTPTIARLLAGVEKKGWVSRPKARSDGRRKALQLTSEGQTLIDTMLSDIRKDMTRIYRQAGEPSVSGALELLEAIVTASGDSDPA